MKIRFVESLDNITYAIRDFAPLAKKLEKNGEKIIYLNIGDPLKYDFNTPKHIIEAAYKAVMIENKNFYSESQGVEELREAIAEEEKRYNDVDIDKEDVIVTQGVSEGISFIARILLDINDNLLIPSPSYPLYIGGPMVYYSHSLEYRMIEEEDWAPDIDDIRNKINSKTKAIIILNPNNPTGAVYEEKTIRGIIDIAGEYNLPIISDEIYNKNIYDNTILFKSPATLSKDIPVFVLNGFSKAYLMTGWRVGYLFLHDPSGENKDRAKELLLKLSRLRICPSTPAQYAALAALKGPQDHIKEVNDKFDKRSKIFYKRISDSNFFTASKPKAAFYIFPRIEASSFKDDRVFAKKLLEEAGVFIVHGSGFGTYGEQHFRAVTLPPEDIIELAMDKMENFLEKYEKNLVSIK